MMREHIQVEASFQHEDEIESQRVQQIKTRARNGFIAILVFALFVGSLSLFRYYSTSQLLRDGQFYQNQLMSTQMLPFWKELSEEEESTDKQMIIEQGTHNISRQELGHMGWTMLHMMTGSFPQEITPELVKKWNSFLVLFGQFYPCKLCSGHFLTLLKEVGPFTGHTKEGLMIYLCEIHNKVNKRLGHPLHSCKDIKDQWNTCGCSESRLL